jgi:hypothetical protein
MIFLEDGDRINLGEAGGVGDLTNLLSTLGETGLLVCEKTSLGGRLELLFSTCWTGLVSHVTDFGLADLDLDVAKSRLLNLESVTGLVCLK